MGGGDGVIIVHDAAVALLTNPLVHGRLPATMTGSLDPVLSKDIWDDSDREVVARAMHWVVCTFK